MAKHARGHGRGGHGPHRGRERARRGATVEAVLLLLAERPMHGYEIIAELDERSGGNWRPSPGSIYPALRRMESKGVIVGAEDDDGKRVYDLTDDGRARHDQRDPDAPAPWEAFADDGASLRPAIHELVSQARQIGRFGSAEQREQARTILTSATSELYSVMAKK